MVKPYAEVSVIDVCQHVFEGVIIVLKKVSIQPSHITITGVLIVRCASHSLSHRPDIVSQFIPLHDVHVADELSI